MIPFVDLKTQLKVLRPEINEVISRVIDQGHFVLGPSVSAFEEKFSTYCRTDHCVGVNSGASALHLALLAAGVGPGDEVITVSMTFVATVAAVLYCGAKPVLVDVDPDRWTMAPELIEAAITPRTKAILPVHLHGLMADMDPIMAVARRHGLVVVEDAAQSHGAEYKGRRAGSIGDIGCFSFYPGKNLGGFGEGGAVVTRDAGLARTVRLLRDWGQEEKYRHVLPGYNYRMDAIQGAILNLKMDYIEGWTEDRRRLAHLYDQELAAIGQKRPSAPSDNRHVYHVYSIEHPRRDALQAALTAAGIGTGIHYPVPVHLQPAYENLGYGRGDLPVTEALAERFLSLPMYPELAPDQVVQVCRELERAHTAEQIEPDSRAPSAREANKVLESV